jgi:hypothetical protein
LARLRRAIGGIGLNQVFASVEIRANPEAPAYTLLNITLSTWKN